jgi:WD40 repeat protein
MIATGGHSFEDYFMIKVWDAKTGKLVANLKGHTNPVTCLAWTTDGKTLISGSHDCSIRTWNTTTWQQIALLTGHTDYVLGIAISPNGRILASASWDDTARLWNLENGQPISLPLEHGDEVVCTSFSTDSKLLATGCRKGNAYTWDISAIVKEAGLGEHLLNQNVSRPSFSTREICCMRRVYKPSSSLNISISGWCYTTSGRLAQEPLSRPFQQHTSSSPRASLGSCVVFSDLRILSSLEGRSCPHPLHISSISPRIYLCINAHPLNVSPRYPEATTTMRVAHRPNRTF